jgi:hypothetical protein
MQVCHCVARSLHICTQKRQHVIKTHDITCLRTELSHWPRICNMCIQHVQNGKNDKELLSKQPMPEIDGCQLSQVDVYLRWKGLHNLPRSSSAQKARYNPDICNVRNTQQTNTKYTKQKPRHIKEKTEIAQGWVGSPDNSGARRPQGESKVLSLQSNGDQELQVNMRRWT